MNIVSSVLGYNSNLRISQISFIFCVSIFRTWLQKYFLLTKQIAKSNICKIMRLYDTKRDSIEDSIDDEDESNLYPFRMTKAELQSLDPNFKEKKKKVNI